MNKKIILISLILLLTSVLFAEYKDNCITQSEKDKMGFFESISSIFKKKRPLCDLAIKDLKDENFSLKPELDTISFNKIDNKDKIVNDKIKKSLKNIEKIINNKNEKIINNNEKIAKYNSNLKNSSVFFDFKSYKLKNDQKSKIDYIKNIKFSNIELDGYADERGTIQFNDKLSMKRALAVKDYLLEIGIPKNKIAVSWYGKTKSFCLKPSEFCYQKNRRVKIKLK